ncbi:2-phospho-L-lactate guanylyltransferase [Novosphingobium colocasiae]|uniref:2-phospho-L-lactate guanylyltransferase n=1 Tax=Novosphingobium colocasiae TaxID=1256513 RepID=A0A918PCM0_9SPHN|nr:2-phospho-L-lactate guanylyltransferase [Novosphingobium colocasiae]GGY98235.1 hypothetical protein GCM10011614_11730 [Novosphingobium colocasiae]
MTWRVVVPIKQPGSRKSRLAGALDAAAREDLAERMFRHVMAVLAEIPGVSPLVLCPVRPAGWSGEWVADWDEVNVMLAALRGAVSEQGFCTINADLPLLCGHDVSALLAAAGEAGIALAPDRGGTGTNAVALAPGHTVDFHFGPGSFAAFARETGALARTVTTPGLATDIDCAEDLAIIATACSA